MLCRQTEHQLFIDGISDCQTGEERTYKLTTGFRFSSSVLHFFIYCGGKISRTCLIASEIVTLIPERGRGRINNY